MTTATATAATDEQVNRAAQAVALARAERRAEQRARSMRIWGHSGAHTSIPPLSLREEAAIALRTAEEVAEGEDTATVPPLSADARCLLRWYRSRPADYHGLPMPRLAAAYEALLDASLIEVGGDNQTRLTERGRAY